MNNSAFNITKRKIKITFYGLLLIIPLVLVFLPKTFFNEGQSICVSFLLFDTECYGCGMTRAIQHLLHLDFSAAYSFNRLSFIVLPLSLYVIVTELIKAYKSDN